MRRSAVPFLLALALAGCATPPADTTRYAAIVAAADRAPADRANDARRKPV